MNVRQTLLIVLYVALTVLFLWWLPRILYGFAPLALRAYVDAGNTGALIILILGVPAALILMFIASFLSWLLLGRLFARREDVEGLLKATFFGSDIGPTISRLVERIYRSKQ